MNQFMICATNLNKTLPEGFVAQVDIIDNESISARRTVRVFDSKSGNCVLELGKAYLKLHFENTNKYFIEWFDDNWVTNVWAECEKLPMR